MTVPARQSRIYRWLVMSLLSLTLGACGHASTVPSSAAKSATTTPSAALPPAAPAKPVPVKQVSTRLSIAPIDGAPVAPDARSAVAAISKRVAECWRGPESPDAPPVSLQLSLNQDGSVRTIAVLDKKSFSGNAGYRAAATKATSALFECSPFALPAAGYASWKSLPLQITPHH
jgi:hypothetical protein